MKITGVEFFRLDMPLAVPYTIAYESIHQTSNIIFKVLTDSKLVGWGCAAPDMEVTGESAEDVIHNIETVVKDHLIGQSPFQLAKINHELLSLIPNASSTMAMVDMALYDLMARKAHIPLFQLLGGFRNQIATSITIGILPLKETLEQAKYFMSKGFKIIKLKGGLNLEEDIEKIYKIREYLGPEGVIRFDANQGYTAKQAIKFIKDTKKAVIEMLEQPSGHLNDSVMKEITQNTSVPVMADESIKTLQDAFRLTSDSAIDMVNIKIMKVGGILEAQHINSVAKAAGKEVMIGCMDECALGIAAGLHFALSRPNIEFADLDGHLDLLEDPFLDLFELKDGMMRPYSHPGLGKIKAFN